MSDSSYIGHLISSMVYRLAEVISNGGGVAHQFHNDSVRKTWFFKGIFKVAGFLFKFI